MLLIIYLIINSQVICLEEKNSNINKLNLLKNLLSNIQNKNDKLSKFLIKKEPQNIQRIINRNIYD